MSERKVGPTIPAGEWLLVPIEEVQVHEYCSEARFNLFVAKSPAAVVAIRRRGALREVMAADRNGRELDIEELATEVPGLRERLDELMASF